jgi:F-type H+-transporting ATPase subunit b
LHVVQHTYVTGRQSKDTVMSFFTRNVAWLAVLALCSGIFLTRPCVAQEGESEAAAEIVAHEAEEAESGGPNPLAVDPDLAIWTFVVFVVLFGLLSVLAWPQIAAALDERERKITDNIAAAEARLADAKRVVAEHEAKLAAAAGEVRALLEEARRDAEHTRKSIETKGHQAAQDELARAIREIERAKDGAIQELAQSSANVAVELARKVIREKLSPEEQKQIVREALGKLTAASPSKN